MIKLHLILLFITSILSGNKDTYTILPPKCPLNPQKALLSYKGTAQYSYQSCLCFMSLEYANKFSNEVFLFGPI